VGSGGPYDHRTTGPPTTDHRPLTTQLPNCPTARLPDCPTDHRPWTARLSLTGRAGQPALWCPWPAGSSPPAPPRDWRFSTFRLGPTGPGVGGPGCVPAAAVTPVRQAQGLRQDRPPGGRAMAVPAGIDLAPPPTDHRLPPDCPTARPPNRPWFRQPATGPVATCLAVNAVPGSITAPSGTCTP
jgi:hypothetical protein